MSTERESRVSSSKPDGSASSASAASPDAARVPANTSAQGRSSSNGSSATVDNAHFAALVRSDLESRIRRDNLDTWFKHLVLTSLAEKEVVFSVPSGFVRDFLTRNHLSSLRRAVQNVGGVARDVRIVVQTRPVDGDAARRAGVDAVLSHVEDDTPPLTSYEAERRRARGQGAGGSQASGFSPHSQPARPGAESSAGDGHENDTSHSSCVEFSADAGRNGSGVCAGASSAGGNGAGRASNGLNAGHSFETFVVGPCNRLGHAAALAIVENPGRAYNPLFIHGGVGLGKTHLLQAICLTVRRRYPSKRVAYSSCEEFTNQFINAVQCGKLDGFREFYRGVDVLVVDDVQFLAGKDRTQEEFFHTFNVLYNSHRQVVMSSDCAPVEIPTLEERLVSRFKWGFVAQLEPPCYETRYAIVQRKAKARNVEMPDEVVRFIAETIDTNVRELEGAVVKLLGVATLTGKSISLEVAQEALSGVARPRARRVTMDFVMNVIAREFSLSPRDITGKSRVSHVSSTRQLGMYLCRQHTDHSLEEIGRFFGNRDHTTVIYGLAKIKKRLHQDRSFQALVERLAHRVGAGH